MMKHTYRLWLAACTCMVILLSACKKDYYQDTGTAKGRFNGSVMDYLQSKPDYFSNVVKVIGYAKMEQVFSKENITFFAPANPCFDSSVNLLNKILYLTGRDTIKTLDQVHPEVWRQLLARYVFKGKMMLNDIPQVDFLKFKTYPGQIVRSYDGVPMNLGVVYGNEGGAEYVGYRQLHISYQADISQPLSTWYKAPVASVNIEPDNGAVHVLVFTQHYFGFDINEFYNLCLRYGIAGK
ncbi:hypothetical protein ECE50_012080 [Chitinophaga sp. Mgbs1]|uniref:FAS1 domain-containing protein n=1 Tax=Chitinophaga solisilvae TaxID=1233460 RepID=A0A3S1AXN1_9BACT|nr:hypothetical protein [Chitinophaga solisilvae]